MRNPGGQATWYGAEGKPLERDTFTCCHCNRVVVVPPKASPSDLGGWCGLCAKPVCPQCAGKECVPFEMKLEQIESRERFFRQVGI